MKVHEWPRAFGGGRLEGNRWVRLIYLDEAGTNPSDPVTVVAGVIVDADRQWLAVQQRLAGLYSKFPPDVRPNRYPFHATELYSGGRYYKKHGRYSKEERWAILDEILALPCDFGMPIVFGFSSMDHLEPTKIKARFSRRHFPAYFSCITAANEYIVEVLPHDEIASLTVEDNKDVRSHIRDAHKRILHSRTAPAEVREAAAINRIIDTVQFADKSEAPFLQIADACTFTLARYLAGKKDSKRFYDTMTGACLLTPDKWFGAAHAGNMGVVSLYGEEWRGRSSMANMTKSMRTRHRVTSSCA